MEDAERKLSETEWKDKSAREVALRRQGLKMDEKGNAVPLQYEDMSPTEQAVHDLKVAQADSQTAKAALDQIKADPNSPQNKAALQRIRVMAQNAATAAGKLGLEKDMIEHHLGARSIPDSALVAVQRLTNGDVLSPDQWEAFHKLIGESRKLSWGTAVKEAKRANLPVDFLPQDLQREAGGGKGGAETQVHNGFEYTKGADGQWHKGKAVQQ
jgi:hypothetical protein